MLTDDDLTRELGAAFRSATVDLTYQGRTRPPRRIAAAVPAATGAAVLAAVAIGAVHAGDSAHRAVGPAAIRPSQLRPSSVRPTGSQRSTGTKHRLITETMSLAGFKVTFQAVAGAPVPVIAEVITGGLPPGVTSVPLTGTQTQAWVGKDPVTGDNALYVKVPTADGGRLFALLSATLTQDQLVAMFENPEPSAVPEVSSRTGGSGG